MFLTRLISTETTLQVMFDEWRNTFGDPGKTRVIMAAKKNWMKGRLSHRYRPPSGGVVPSHRIFDPLWEIGLDEAGKPQYAGAWIEFSPSLDLRWDGLRGHPGGSYAKADKR